MKIELTEKEVEVLSNYLGIIIDHNESIVQFMESINWINEEYLNYLKIQDGIIRGIKLKLN